MGGWGQWALIPLEEEVWNQGRQRQICRGTMLHSKGELVFPSPETLWRSLHLKITPGQQNPFLKTAEEQEFHKDTRRESPVDIWLKFHVGTCCTKIRTQTQQQLATAAFNVLGNRIWEILHRNWCNVLWALPSEAFVSGCNGILYPVCWVLNIAMPTENSFQSYLWNCCGYQLFLHLINTAVKCLAQIYIKWI